MFVLKKLLAALTLPPTGPILLAFVGLCLGRQSPRIGRSIAAIALIALAALSEPYIAHQLIRSLEHYPPLSNADLSKAQVIVILGGGAYHDAPEYGTDTVSRHCLERIRYGVHLQRISGLPILVTGGAPYGGQPEADVMRDSIIGEFGGQVRWIEPASLDTAENASFSARLLKKANISRIALVSQAWHLPRATELFQRQGLEVLPAPTGFSTSAPSALSQWLPSASAMEASATALHEWLGIFVQHYRNRLH